VKSQLEVLISQMYDSGILYAEAVREFKKTFIAHVLEQNRGNQCKAARQLGMHRNTLSRTLDELGLDVKEIRRSSAERRPPRSVQPAAQAAMEQKAAR
jgi:DNA-binding NtrC family response regulator